MRRDSLAEGGGLWMPAWTVVRWASIWLSVKMLASERRSDVGTHTIGQRPSGAASVCALRP